MKGDVLWKPGVPAPDGVLHRYRAWVRERHEVDVDDYDALWRWSVDDLDAFWSSVWDFFDIVGERGAQAFVPGDDATDATWFPDARLNFAAQALDPRHAGTAVVARSQTVPDSTLTWPELREQVGRCRAGLQRLGVQAGDRVAAYLPNCPEALVAFLAAASLGAVWASCPPEFGAQSVLDRLGQLEPVVLLVVAGYRYGDRAIDRSEAVGTVCGGLPSVRAVVQVPYLGGPIAGALSWADVLAHPGVLEFEWVPFDSPLYVLFSSGTTGTPKAIVHGHGGILVEHLKALGLHHDLASGDRFFWFTTTGWMMWNLLVSGLCLGSTIVLFDGDPSSPDLGALWRLAGETGATVFGVSAPLLLACCRAGLDLADLGDLSAVRAVGSTGAPLTAEGCEWVATQLPGRWLSSISGGTDVCSAFVGGSPMVPVRSGELSCRFLGARVEAFDDDGRPVRDAEGELVLTAPMPSMPVAFWADPTGERYRDAYYRRFPQTWCHGDWITISSSGSCVISGRSDATLNRGGVRLGTSEFYAVVESFEEVADSLVVHLEDPDGGNGSLLLFVALADGIALDDTLRSRLQQALRRALSPRHGPDRIEAMPAIPRTSNGKKLEIPVKRVLLGASAFAASPENAAVLEPFASKAAEWARQGAPVAGGRIR